MIFEVSKNGNLFFSEIHPVLVELLRAVSLDPWERYPDGSGRLLPAPGSDEELCLDWEDHVQPGLRQHFASERAIVTSDLEAIREEIGEKMTSSLEIPLKHCDAWLTTLNALRLSLAEEYRFSEADLSEKIPPDLSTERGLAMMQVDFYAFLQECLLRAMEKGGE